MAKLLKHFGIGVKKTGSTGSSSHRGGADYNAQKSNSVQELLPKSPTRYRSSQSLSTAAHEYDTHSLKLYPVAVPATDANHHQRPPYATNGKHDHRGSGSSGGSRSKEQKNLSPKSNSNSDGYYTSYMGIESTLPEERDVFDSSPDAALAPEPTAQTATPPRLLDEYCDPLDLKKTVSDGTELLGAIAPTPALDDDYSVPYEVKKILKGVRPKDRGANAVGQPSGGQPADLNGCLMEDSFDEPWEWNTKLSALVAQNPSVYPQGNCLTPMMTPKKTKRACGQAADKADDGNALVNGDDRSSGKGGLSPGSTDDDHDDRGPDLDPDNPRNVDSDVQTFNHKLSLLQEGTGKGIEQLGRDHSALHEREHTSLTKSDIMTPDRIGSTDGLSGGLVIITEISPVIAVDPCDCHIVIPDMGNPGDLPSVKRPDSMPVVSTDDAESSAKVDRSFQNFAKEKHERADNLANTRSWSSASESMVSSTPRKCGYGKQSQSHHGDGGTMKTSKMVSSKSGGCVSSKSNHVTALSCSNTKEKINPDIALEQQSWYHGSIGRVEAEELLQSEKDGSFLVRMSESSKLDYSLSLKSGRGFLHMKIVNLDGKFILGQFSQPFDSIPQMIEFYCMSKLPIKGNENISLIHPLANECGL